MTSNLITHVANFIDVSDELADRLINISKPLIVEKGEILHSPSKVCKNTYFINAGLLRIFYQKDDKEITDNFCAEGEWITSIYSFMNNIPDNFYIETLERSDLLAIDILQLEQCFNDFPLMERFGRMLISSYFMKQSERIISLQFHTAKEKYHYFYKTEKNKLSRVPLGMLASYLGITQETLSRIRAEKNAF